MSPQTDLWLAPVSLPIRKGCFQPTVTVSAHPTFRFVDLYWHHY